MAPQERALAAAPASAPLAATAPLQAASAPAIATGRDFVCLMDATGAVKCLGDNTYGQLGNGTAGNDSLVPVAVHGLAGARAITAGGDHACALDASAGVLCWGDNTAGELGNGTTTGSSTPVAVTGLSSGVAAVSAGDAHTCALTTAGGVKCWGANGFGRLGDGSNAGSSSPVDVVGLSSGVVAVSAGAAHTCALMATGRVKCWGYNMVGALGDGTTTDSALPVDVVGLSDAVSISAGVVTSCAVTQAGAVKCWGYNVYGQLGDGTNTQSNVPVAVAGLSTAVGSVDTGISSTCALSADGAVDCWGGNFSGQLGNGTWYDSFTPVRVIGLDSGVRALSVSPLFACALTDSGFVKCWGSNNHGQLGDGTVTVRNSPYTTMSTDALAPVAQALIGGTLGGQGFYRSDVTVQWNWTDSGGSGIDAAACTSTSTSSSDGNPVILSAQCRDLAGNVGSASVSVRIDRQGPAAAPSFSPGWSRADVSVSWNWSDAVSGVDGANCALGSTSLGEGAAVVVSASCKDIAGNGSAASVVVKVDKTPPTLSPTVTPGVVLQYLAATASANAADALSGVVTSSCAVPTTTAAGTASVPCTATDAAGNVGTQPANYVVDAANTALNKLIAQVNGLGLDKSSTKTLVSYLQNAQSSLSRNNKTQAIDRINSFIAQVNAWSGGRIPRPSADAMVVYANLIIASIKASP